ncbi:hypothetical protein PanWU01x14_051120, partial [Parasponia andersonii]
MVEDFVRHGDANQLATCLVSDREADLDFKNGTTHVDLHNPHSDVLDDSSG